MKVYVVSAMIFILCNTLGTAQGIKNGPTPAQKAALFQRNYPLIEKLVDNSLKLTRQTDPLSRSENFRGTFLELEQQILAALRESDANRLGELNSHLKSLCDKALLPSLGAAREKISQNHPQEPRLFGVRDMTDRMSEDLQKAVRESNLATSPEAKKMLETLLATKVELEKRMELPVKTE